MKYKASCHCGQVALEFEGEMQEALVRNCPICQRKGSLRTLHRGIDLVSVPVRHFDSASV